MSDDKLAEIEKRLENDRDFIAHAPTDIRDLIDEVKRLRKFADSVQQDYIKLMRQIEESA